MGLSCYNANCHKVRNGIAISCDCPEWETCPQFYGAKPKIDEPYSMEDKIRPAHYQGEYECIDLMREIYGDEAVRWFCILNAYKYRFRAGKKEGNEWADDQKKAAWYETYVMKNLSRNPYTDALKLKKLMEDERDLRRSDPTADDDR